MIILLLLLLLIIAVACIIAWHVFIWAVGGLLVIIFGIYYGTNAALNVIFEGQSSDWINLETFLIGTAAICLLMFIWINSNGPYSRKLPPKYGDLASRSKLIYTAIICIIIGLLASIFTKPNVWTGLTINTLTPELTAEKYTPPAFPNSQYWPKQVAIMKPVVLSGQVSVGIIKETANKGDILDATLSTDHNTVFLRRLDITGSIPIELTDFVNRAKKEENLRSKTHIK